MNMWTEDLVLPEELRKELSAEGTGQLHSLDSGKIRKNTGKEEKSSDNLSGRRI